MICPKCHGARIRLKLTGQPFIKAYEECDYCLGEGNVHCCEGDAEQPDGNREEIVYESSSEYTPKARE